MTLNNTSQISETVPCIEGQLVQCETNNYNNVILLNSLDDNFRFYLPELQIAENGILVYNTNNGTQIGEPWDKVENLNTISAQSKVFKFGYDSKRMAPYLQFTEDVDTLIGDGLIIYYMRTSGVNGNISARTLTTLMLGSTKLKTTAGDEIENLSADDFLVQNLAAAKMVVIKKV